MTPKELYSRCNKLVDMDPNIEGLKIQLSKVPPDYCLIEYRKLRGNSTYSYIEEGTSTITYKYETMSTPAYIMIFGLPANTSLKQSIVDLNSFMKKYPTSKLALNDYELAVLIKVFGDKLEYSYVDTEFYDIVENKLSIMNTSKWKKGKRVSKIMSMCEFRELKYSPSVYNDAYELIHKWQNKDRKIKFYMNILESLDNENRVTYGMYYNDKLIYIESGSYYGDKENLVIDMGIGIGGITENNEEYKNKFPKILSDYINMVCRYNMYQEYTKLGIKRVFAGGIGGSGTDGLYNHKLKTYTDSSKRYKVNFKKGVF